MKATVLDLNGQKKSDIELPKQFNEKIREDLIQKAVLSLQSGRRNPYGANPRAGKRSSVAIKKRRRDFRGSYGHGISRTPRKVMSRNGTRFFWVGAFAPNTVGGRRAHPPKAEKIFAEKINEKERLKAIRCAISATIVKDLIKARGHMVPENVPIIVEDKLEAMSKTKEIKKVLENLKLGPELVRCQKKKVRAGKGKLRNRKYKTKTGPLIIVSKKCNLQNTAKNLPGVSIVNVSSLNVEYLAPGTQAGRLAVWTQGAIEKMKQDNLFTK
ncbi:50S ribosomal protein L4 [Candidatus Woesearchaeota archaeon]|nr:50S ribosomal protein L4 [Candidatus Woesearchaeota archaeon]